MANEWKEKMEASANRLRDIRLNMGVSQEKFAEYLDISLSAYKKIESADNGISVNVLRRLRERFHISADYLLFGDYKSFEEGMQVIQNCSESDKMKIYLRLTKYFVEEKKKIFVDSENKGEDESSQIVNDILNRE